MIDKSEKLTCENWLDGIDLALNELPAKIRSLLSTRVDSKLAIVIEIRTEVGQREVQILRRSLRESHEAFGEAPPKSKQKLRNRVIDVISTGQKQRIVIAPSSVASLAEGVQEGILFTLLDTGTLGIKRDDDGVYRFANGAPVLPEKDDSDM